MRPPLCDAGIAKQQRHPDIWMPLIIGLSVLLSRKRDLP